jgi:hypothetical protein
MKRTKAKRLQITAGVHQAKYDNNSIFDETCDKKLSKNVVYLRAVIS